MKIISDYHDYYDRAAAFGHDDSSIYIRTNIEHKLDGIPNSIKPIVEYLDNVTEGRVTENKYRIGILRNKNCAYEFIERVLVFCGKLYPVVLMKRYKVVPGVTDKLVDYKCFYERDSLDSYLTEVKESGASRIRNFWPPYDRNIVTERFFDLKNKDIRDWAIANKAICLELRQTKLIVNPVIGDVKFFNVFGPYEAYQELEMWVGGTLAYPQNAMVEIEDKYRVEAHGFDAKYGFRKRPEEKHK